MGNQSIWWANHTYYGVIFSASASELPFNKIWL